MGARQSVKAARSRVTVQTARNVRYGFPQRGRYSSVRQSVQGAYIVLSLSAGHREWPVKRVGWYS